MAYGLLADLVFTAHLCFIAWVVLGALAVLRWPFLAWFHLPAVAWGASVELAGLWCPLTPIEQQLLRAAGDAGYEGGFITHYLLPVIYPAGLTPTLQWLLGGVVIVVNVMLYGLLLTRRRHGKRARHTVD